MSTERGDEWVLAHLSDPHLTRLNDLSKRELLNKRLLGYLSWLHRRRHEHLPEVLDALIADIEQIKPDHTAITGDLTHLGTPGEFVQAAAWLRRIGPPEDVTLVPGNHDAYVSTPWMDTFSHWTQYMASDEDHGDVNGGSIFPSLRLRGRSALIGVNSGVPSPPLLAVGHLGQSQLSDLSRMLRETGAAGLFRVLLIHHPPVPGSIKWRKRLTDANGLVSVIEEHGVELVLHGHAHRSSLYWIKTPGGKAPVIGVGSASELSESTSRRAQYHIYRLTNRSGKPEMTVSVREYSPQAGCFEEVGGWEDTVETWIPLRFIQATNRPLTTIRSITS